MFMKQVTLIFMATLMALTAHAQYFASPPAIDGSKDAGYSTTVNGWSLGWDETYLYICKTGGSAAEPAVAYIDFDNSLIVSGGTDTDGSFNGKEDWGVTPTLPFRADIRLYWVASYAEITPDNGLGGWGSATTIPIADRTDGTSNREIRLSWTSVLGLGGKPNEFNFVGHCTITDAVSPFIYDQIPNNNQGGSLGTPRLFFYQSISNTSSAGSVDALSPTQRSFETRADYFYGGSQPGTLYNMTINRTGGIEEAIRMGRDLTIRNNLVISGISALFRANAGSVENTITFTGNDGIIQVGEGSAMLGESDGNLIYIVFDGYTTLDQIGENSIDCRQFTINEGDTVDANTAALNSNTDGTFGVANINGTIITTNPDGFSGTTTNTVRNSFGTVNMGSNSTVVYAATSGTQTVTSRADYANVTITGGSEKSMASTGDITLSGTLALEDGILTTGANRVIVSSAATTAITDYSIDSYVNGNLRRRVSTPGNYAFPVGTAAQYELAEMNFTSGSGFTDIDANFTATALPSPSGLVSEGSEVDGITTDVLQFLNYGYWTLNAVGTPTGIDYDLTLTSRGHSNAANEVEKHGIFQNTGTASGSWTEPGIQFDADTVVDIGVALPSDPISIRIDGVSAFQNFAIGLNVDNILPVTLSAFDATVTGIQQVTLNWVTESEVNSSYFDVERSPNASDWTFIGKRIGQGTTTATTNYTLVDEQVPAGVHYYRLKQVDFNGAYAYSEVVSATMRSAGALSFSPNPANDQLNVPAGVELRISDLTGKTLLYTQTNSNTLDISSLPAGFYMVEMWNGEDRSVQQLVVAE
jgi:hypothetical protein